MFQSLKQKIAKETGQDITRINFNRSTSSTSNSNKILSSRNSICSNQSLDNSSKDDLSPYDEKEAEINILRQELLVAQNRIKSLEVELEKLKDSLRVTQVSKDLMFEETDKIHNAQHHEIEKLKSLLLFREQVISYTFPFYRISSKLTYDSQESLDQLNKSKSDESQIEHLKAEITRIKNIEEMFEELQVKIKSSLIKVCSLGYYKFVPVLSLHTKIRIC